ncbi:Kynurenine--oxoglutarate transaminase 3 [Cichlidogyrus casuarinus]|uniref:kynurenine--oxoglutarate transaminase n=1 Tax=Cichlidogyrus casuarinus TaxID=1844966 RepID=A0ABD2QL95_9PLAT
MSSCPGATVEPAKAMQNVPPSIWVSINQSVAKYKPVNMGQGFPDFAPPTQVLDNLAQVAKDENQLLHQYTRSMGHPRLVQVLAKLYTPFFQCSSPTKSPGTFTKEHQLDPLTNIVISGGAYGSLFTAFSALLNSGDECVVMEPNFDCYGPMILQAGGKPLYVQLRPKKGGHSSADWTLDFDQLENVVSSKKNHFIHALIPRPTFSPIK